MAKGADNTPSRGSEQVAQSPYDVLRGRIRGLYDLKDNPVEFNRASYLLANDILTSIGIIGKFSLSGNPNTSLLLGESMMLEFVKLPGMGEGLRELQGMYEHDIYGYSDNKENDNGEWLGNDSLWAKAKIEGFDPNIVSAFGRDLVDSFMLEISPSVSREQFVEGTVESYQRGKGLSLRVSRTS